MGKPAATAIRSGIPRAARVKNRQSRSAQRYSSMSVSCEPIRDRSGRRQAVAPLLAEATRRSINTQASHPGNGSPHGKKRTFFRRAIGWESFPARRHEQPANGGKRTKRLRFCIASYRTSFNGRKASPHKEAINEKQKIMEKKQSTALEKADTATLTLSILFVVSILCTILFSLTA